MIDGLLGFIFGFALCLAFWLRRSIEQRRAFNAACGLIEIHRERETRYRAIFSNIRAMAQRMKSNRHLDLGGRAMLPASAEPTGQRFSHPFTSVIAGSSVKGGPDFSESNNGR